jgi:hypothetical protein
MRNITKALAMLPVLPLALTLQGCGSDSKVRVAQPPQDHLLYQPGTHPRFDPGGSDLPFNNDLIFLTPAGSQGAAFDGTANISSPANPVITAVNALDGFSTNAPFDILLSGSVVPASVLPGQTVFLLELTSSGEVLDPTNITGVAGLAPINAMAVSVDGGTNNAIRITPTQPLKAKTKYLAFLTNNIVDTQGEPLTTSWTYNALRGDSFNATGSLASVRSLVRAWDGIAGAALAGPGATPEQIAGATETVVIAYTFTTTDPTTPLVAMAAPRAALVQAMMGFGIPQMDAVANAGGLNAMGYLSTPVERDLGISAMTAVDLNVLTGGALPADVGSLYTGYIKLPYYLEAPQQAGDTAYTQSAWQADPTLGSLLSAQLPEGTVLPPADVDGMTYNVTYRYPFAGRKGTESVPLQVTLPDDVAGCATTFPSGLPVVMAVHGITSDRSSVVALAHALAGQCVATVAIDLPLHGVEPTSAFAALNVESSSLIPFGVLYGADAPRERFFNDPGGSGAQFINLTNLINTRDNLRQAVMDLLNLNASLDALSAQLDGQGLGVLDTSSIKVVGGSLGGMVATVMTTVNQMAIGAEMQASFTSNLRPISGLVASVAGSQLTQILLNSDSLGPVIRGGLQAAGVVPGTTNFERFIYAAQSTVDSADPVNFAATLDALGVPVLLQQVNGDAVVPNDAPNLPLAGTAGLIDLLGAVQSGPSMAPVNMAVAPGVVKMLNGSHSSLLDPTASPTVTAEMQTQVVSFVLSSGAGVAVGAASAADVETP